MKSAAILAAAVTLFTLFLESSTAPADSSVVVVENAGVNIGDLISGIGDTIKAITGIGAQVKVDVAEKQQMNRAIDTARRALNGANDVLAADLVKSKGGETIIISGVSFWANNLLLLTVNIQNQIRAAIDSGSVIELEKATAATIVSVAVAKKEYSVFTNVLSGKTKADFDREMRINFDNADAIIAGLKRILSGESSRPVA